VRELLTYEREAMMTEKAQDRLILGVDWSSAGSGARAKASRRQRRSGTTWGTWRRGATRRFGATPVSTLRATPAYSGARTDAPVPESHMPDEIEHTLSLEASIAPAPARMEEQVAGITRVCTVTRRPIADRMFLVAYA
jgi:hypothetical protein